nr:hypothetical protein [Tanacetum cinerariifolium]
QVFGACPANGRFAAPQPTLIHRRARAWRGLARTALPALQPPRVRAVHQNLPRPPGGAQRAGAGGVQSRFSALAVLQPRAAAALLRAPQRQEPARELRAPALPHWQGAHHGGLQHPDVTAALNNQYFGG